MEKTVVTILAIGHSGSHYLSLLLGSHSQAMHIGEVNVLGKRQPVKQKKVCHLCKDNNACPVFRDIGPRNINSVYDIIFSHSDPSITVLIDNSKGVRWAMQHVSNTTYRMKYIHLIRDPRAIVRYRLFADNAMKQQLMTRFKVIRSFPRRALSFLFADLHEIYLYDWLVRNQKMTDFIRRHHLDASVVTYLDLARETDIEVKKLMDWIGLGYEPAQLEYWNFEHHGTQKMSYEWVKQQKVRYIDLRWKTDLSSKMIDRIVKNPDINAYVTRMGLAFSDDGLTRTAATPAQDHQALHAT